MGLEPSLPVRRPAEGDGLLFFRRLPIRAAVVRRRALRSIRPGRRRGAPRQRTVARADVLAERVQPGPRAVSAQCVRGCGRRERALVPISVLDRRARRASVLEMARGWWLVTGKTRKPWVL